MQRTINEVYELIKQKKDNALNDNKRAHTLIESYKLQSQIDAYTDIIILIETSGILTKEKTAKTR